MFGFSGQEIIGSSSKVLIPEDRLNFAQYVTEPDMALEFFDQVFEQGSVADWPMTVRRPRGRDPDRRPVQCVDLPRHQRERARRVRGRPRRDQNEVGARGPPAEGGWI
jgi:hypothetical protein